MIKEREQVSERFFSIIFDEDYYSRSDVKENVYIKQLRIRLFTV